MNTGMKTIEWLFNEQLKVDDKWSVRTPNGFRWWADKNEQTVEVIGQETGPDGDIGIWYPFEPSCCVPFTWVIANWKV